MLTLRLARVGRKKHALYRLVAADSKRAVSGKYVSLLGTYDPHTKNITLNKEAILTYLSQGAQPSDTVARLLVREGVKLPEWAQPAPTPQRKKGEGRKSKDAPKGESAAPAAAPAAEGEAVVETATEQADTDSAAEQSESTVETAETEAAEAAVAPEAETAAAEAAILPTDTDADKTNDEEGK